MFEKEVPFSFKALCVLKSAYKLSGVFPLYFNVLYSWFFFFFCSFFGIPFGHTKPKGYAKRSYSLPQKTAQLNCLKHPCL